MAATIEKPKQSKISKPRAKSQTGERTRIRRAGDTGRIVIEHDAQGGVITAKVSLKPTEGADALWVDWGGSYVQKGPTIRIAELRTGLNPRLAVSAGNHFGLTRGAIGELIGVSQSTLERKLKKHEVLGLAESERLARIALIEDEAEKVFDDRDMARRWLLSSNTALGAAPMAMLDTDIGATEVRKVLNAIAWGATV